MDEKYYNLIELKSLLANIGEQNYELIHMKEKPLYQRLKERIDKFMNDCDFINKKNNIEESINLILKGLIREDEIVKVNYDKPLYKINLPKNIIDNSKYLYFFIYKCYDIEFEKIILQPLEVVLKK